MYNYGQYLLFLIFCFLYFFGFFWFCGIHGAMCLQRMVGLSTRRLMVEMMSSFIFCGLITQLVWSLKSRQEESGHFSSTISSLAQHVIDMLSVVKTWICNCGGYLLHLSHVFLHIDSPNSLQSDALQFFFSSLHLAEKEIHYSTTSLFSIPLFCTTQVAL